MDIDSNAQKEASSLQHIANIWRDESYQIVVFSLCRCSLVKRGFFWSFFWLTKIQVI
jgi:hypothetical protein